MASPDELRGNVVKAFIVLAADHEPSEELADQIKAFVRERLSAYAYPRRIEFVDDLPKTLTGKIRRIELRQLELERRRRTRLSQQRWNRQERDCRPRKAERPPEQAFRESRRADSNRGPLHYESCRLPGEELRLFFKRWGGIRSKAGGRES